MSAVSDEMSIVTGEALLSVRDLVTEFPIRAGVFRREVGRVQAVSGVSFDLMRNETLGVVGESGCGKTTLGRSLLRLVAPTSGQVTLGDRDITTAGRQDLRELRREIQMVFQDPYASLNPRIPVRDIIGEPMHIHGVPKDEAADRVSDLLTRVGLLPEHGNRYPHEFSGGQRQRIGIARALALNPSLIVGDEPVSALDVSIQAQVINLMMDLQEERDMAYLFIAHDLAVVEHISDEVAVMYLGRIVEKADKKTLFTNPLHPYTEALLSAAPIPDPTIRREKKILQGDVPSPINPPKGCHFHTRCPYAEERCKVEEPVLQNKGNGHIVACHLR